jgi:hypothetical protein
MRTLVGEAGAQRQQTMSHFVAGTVAQPSACKGPDGWNDSETSRALACGHCRTASASAVLL